MHWLRRDDGQQLVIVAILMPVLLAFVGLVIDLGMVYVHHQEAQSAADAAISAAATTFRVYSGDCGATASPAFTKAETSALDYLDTNNAKNKVAVKKDYFGCPKNGMYGAADTQYLQIVLSYPYTPSFIRIIWSGTFQVTAQATAGYQASAGNHFFVALNTESATDFRNPKLHLSVSGGNVYLNSKSELENIEAPAVYLHGTDTSGTGCRPFGVCVKFENAPVLADPLKGRIPAPSYNDINKCPVRSAPYTNPLRPGNYESVPNNFPLVFDARGHTGPSDCDGAFVIKGKLSVGNGNLQIIGGMLYFPPSATEGGGISMGGNGTWTGTPATTGKYAGILVWIDRLVRIDGYGDLDVRGTADGGLAGIIYAPKSQLSLKGNTTVGVYESLNVIVDNLYANGATYFALKGYQGPITPYVQMDGQVE